MKSMKNNWLQVYVITCLLSLPILILSSTKESALTENKKMNAPVRISSIKDKSNHFYFALKFDSDSAGTHNFLKPQPSCSPALGINNIYNVRDCGASPAATGSANAAAFAATVAMMPNNATLYIPPGVYTATGGSLINLTNKSNITIKGEGKGSTTIVFTGTRGISINGSSNISIRGISFNGAMKNGVYGTLSQHLTIRDCGFQGATAEGFGTGGIWLDTCDDVNIEGNALSGNGNGSNVGGAAGGDIVVFRSEGNTSLSNKRVKITNNTAQSTDVTYNIGTSDLENSVISANHAGGASAGNTAVGGYGIMVYRTNVNNAFVGNVNNVTVSNNTVVDTAGAGIFLQGGANKTVTGNIVLNTARTQINNTLLTGGIVSDAGNTTISGNIIGASGGNGIAVMGGIFQINGNTIEDVDLYGILLNTTAHKSNVTSNTITLSSRGIRAVNSNLVIIQGNNLSELSYPVGAIEVENCAQPKIQGNGISSVINSSSILGAGTGITVSSTNPAVPILFAQINENRIVQIGQYYRGIYLNNVQSSEISRNIIGDDSDAGEAIFETHSPAVTGLNTFDGNNITGFPSQYYLTSSAIVRNVTLSFSQLMGIANGSVVYCSDCAKVSPCTSGGTGAVAKREGGVWNCN